jgi:sporulation protein YlmC with PRC-barrel domain
MTDQHAPATLRRLGDSNLTVAFPDEDVRGRPVLDRDGEEVGTVSDLIVDDREARVRFLEVASGGVLGIGETKVLIPVDVIARITDEAVRIDDTREHVGGSPRYDPTLAGRPYWENVYGYYGYGPYWAPGYMYPPYPRLL